MPGRGIRLFGIVMIFLLVLGASGAALAETPDTSSDLATKELLTEDDVLLIQTLSAEERADILIARGWKKVEFPENISSYEDLMRLEGEAAISPRQLEMARENYARMEKELPFNEFKKVERWIPPEKEVRLNFAVIGGWGGGYGDGNECDFNLTINGDVILLKGGGIFPGVFCHAAIVKYNTYTYLFALGADGTYGVNWDSRDELHEYSHASVQRVNTWWLGSGQRQTAADYARVQLGKPYNWNYFNKGTQSSFYCSQLAWAGYYHTTPWYCKLDIDGIPDYIDFGAVAPDAIWASWRTSTATCSD